MPRKTVPGETPPAKGRGGGRPPGSVTPQKKAHTLEIREYLDEEIARMEQTGELKTRPRYLEYLDRAIVGALAAQQFSAVVTAMQTLMKRGFGEAPKQHEHRHFNPIVELPPIITSHEAWLAKRASEEAAVLEALDSEPVPN